MSDNPRGIWRKLMYTPVSDLLRGRVTGRADVRHELREAGLPPTAIDTVCKVLDRLVCGGRRKELVKRELAAHFLRGLEAGRPVEELVDTFGPPRKIAKLINKSIWRGQPAPVRGLVMTMAVVTCLPAYGGLFIYLLTLPLALTNGPQPTVDYLARLNAPAAAVAETDRAWPLYRDVLRTFGRSDPHALFREQLQTEDIYLSREPRPDEPQWERMVEMIDAHQPMLEAIRQAASKPGMGYRVRFEWGMDPQDWSLLIGNDKSQPPPPATLPAQFEDIGFFSLSYSHVGPMRDMSRWLSDDMQVAAARGNGQRVIDDYLALLRMGGHVYEQKLEMSRLVACSFVAAANATLARILNDQPDLFTDEQLATLMNAALIGEACIVAPPDAQWFGSYDAIQHFYGKRGRLSITGARFFHEDREHPSAERHAAAYMALPVMYWVWPTRDQLHDRIESLDDALRELESAPLWTVLHEDARYWRQADGLYDFVWGVWRYLPVLIYGPAGPSSVVTIKQARMYIGVLRIVLALELYRREHGEYPAALEALTPAMAARHPAGWVHGRTADLSGDGGAGRDLRPGHGRRRRWRRARRGSQR